MELSHNVFEKRFPMTFELCQRFHEMRPGEVKAKAVQDLRDYYIANKVNWDYKPLPEWFLMLTMQYGSSITDSTLSPESRSKCALGKAKKVCMGYNSPSGFGCREATEGCKYEVEGGHVCVLCKERSHGLYHINNKGPDKGKHKCQKMRIWQKELGDLEIEFGLRHLMTDDSEDMEMLIRRSVQRAPAPAPKKSPPKKRAAANSFCALGQSSSSESEAEPEALPRENMVGVNMVLAAYHQNTRR